MATVKFSMATQVTVSAGEAWAWSTSPEGVRAEAPPPIRWMFPVGTAQPSFTELVPGHRFVEQMPRLSMRSWRHERVITAAGGGALVTDHLEFTPRMATPLVRPMVRLLFEHRHRMLARALGGQPRPAGGAMGRAR